MSSPHDDAADADFPTAIAMLWSVAGRPSHTDILWALSGGHRARTGQSPPTIRRFSPGS